MLRAAGLAAGASTLLAAAALAPATSAASCKATTFARPSSPAFAATTWPTEHADTWRSHAVPAGLPADIERKLVTRSASLPPVPVWGYVGAGRDLYVVGGAPYLLDMFTKLILGAPRATIPLLTKRSQQYAETLTPYVARIDARTMRVVDTLPLTGGTSANYTGGLLVDANGFLYAVARSTLYKIDPGTFAIVAQVSLPLAPDSSGQPNPQTAYNGIMATANGDLILKGWASTGGGNLPPGMLLRIDPGDLSIKAQVTTTDVASARMALVATDGQEYLYFPDQTQSVRWLVGPSSFALDTGWRQDYLTPKSTAATSAVYMGAGAVFVSNTNPTATAPMQVFAQGGAEGAPLVRKQAFSSDSPSWSFFMPAGDPYQSGIVAVNDELSGHIAGWRACGGGRTVKKLWENDTIASGAGMAIDYRSGQLYADDHRCTTTRCRLYLDVLSLRTGRRLASVRVKGTKPSIGQIFIGPGAVYYVATETDGAHGYVTRVAAR